MLEIGLQSHRRHSCGVCVYDISSREGTRWQSKERMFMHKRRFQRQETMRVVNQSSHSRQNKRGRSDSWWNAGILTAASIIGGLIGFVSLPGDLGTGARLFIALIGILVFLFLGGMLIAGIASVRAGRQSRQALFWWSVAVIASSLLGFFFLPATLFVPIRVFLGACIGYIVSYLLVAL